MSDDGFITREKKPKKEPPKPEPAPEPEPAPAAAEEPVAAEPVAHTPGSKHDESTCPGCARLRSALRETRKRLRRMVTENRTLREELLSAGEMIEDLAADIERPL